jgi:hypothetical protein
MAEAMLDSGVSAVTLCSLLDQNTFTTQFDVTKWNSHANMCSCFRAGANAKSQNIVCLPHGRLWFPLCVLACVCVPPCVCVCVCHPDGRLWFQAICTSNHKATCCYVV